MSKPDDQSKDADRRRDEALKQLLRTPPQPRKKGREPKPGAPDGSPTPVGEPTNYSG